MCRWTKSGCRTRMEFPRTSVTFLKSAGQRNLLTAHPPGVPATIHSEPRGRGTGSSRLAKTVALSAVLLLLSSPGSGAAQLRRDPSVQPIGAVRQGDLLIGLGGAWGADARFPLSGLSGDLLSVGRVTVAWGLASRVLLELRGDVRQILYVDDVQPSNVPLDEGVADGTTSDSGDFRIGILFAPLGSKEGFSAGGRLEVKLPNSDEKKGIGTNTTDFRASLLAGYGRGPWRFTGDVGVGILEAPLENFEQNDVVVYSAEWLFALPGRSARLAVSVDGRASTRGHVPIGTEDLGEVRFGGDLRLGSWLFDGGLYAGYAGNSPDWGFGAGAAWVPRREPIRSEKRSE